MLEKYDVMWGKAFANGFANAPGGGLKKIENILNYSKFRTFKLQGIGS